LAFRATGVHEDSVMMTQLTHGIAATFVAAFLLLVLYVAGYRLCPIEERAIGYDRHGYVRWLATLYAPAAEIESAIVRTHVNLRFRGEFGVPPATPMPEEVQKL